MHGEVDLQLHAFLTSAIDWSEWSPTLPPCIEPVVQEAAWASLDHILQDAFLCFKTGDVSPGYKSEYRSYAYFQI